MNILILGLGSIGQRHLRNLKLVDKKINFFSLRRKFKTPLLNNKNVPQEGDIIRKFKIKNFKNFKEIKNIDTAFICTPSSFHISEAIKLIKKNINVFIEKPLGSNLKNLDKLKNILIKKPNIKAMMGYQHKFNPLILKLKNLIKSKSIGKIYNIFIHHGEHLKDFHPYENYKISYASQKKLGGGVALTQIHELDYLIFLFKSFKIKVLQSFSNKVSKLKINVEDNVMTNLQLLKKKEKIFCFVHLNYYEKPKKRTIALIGEKGKIECNLNKNEILLYKNNKVKKFNFKFKKNLLFIKEIKYFLNCIKQNKKISTDYDVLNGIKSLKLALKIK